MDRIAVPRGKRPRVLVSLDDKERAIQRIRNGETKAGISRELGVPESTVRGWVKRAEQRILKGAIDGPPQPGQGNQHGVMASVNKPMPQAGQFQALQPLRLPAPKRDAAGHIVRAGPAMQVPQPVPLPMQFFNHAAESQVQVFGWLNIFNAGILNFTLIATAAYLQARARGISERLSLWEIISAYVDEAAQVVSSNGGQFVGAALPQPQLQLPTSTSNYNINVPPPSYARGRSSTTSNHAVVPRVHITAEDDEN